VYRNKAKTNEELNADNWILPADNKRFGKIGG